MELFMTIALHWEPFTFLAESSILDRRYYAIYILDPPVKYTFLYMKTIYYLGLGFLTIMLEIRLRFS